MKNTQLNYRNYLISELDQRKKRNPAYSLRAFARDLGVPVSRLSEVINGKVGLSEERAVSIAERLGFGDSDRELFVNLVLAEHARSPMIKMRSAQRVQQRTEAFEKIGEDRFRLISDWHHGAILEVLNTASIEHSVEFIAKRLGLDAHQVETGIERLERLELINKKDGRWFPTHPTSITTTVDIPSEAIRSYHKQILSKAMTAIDHQPVEKRDVSSVMITINKDKIGLAKERLKAFRRQLMAELEADSSRDSVYCMSFQFFEITE